MQNRCLLGPIVSRETSLAGNFVIFYKNILNRLPPAGTLPHDASTKAWRRWMLLLLFRGGIHRQWRVLLSLDPSGDPKSSWAHPLGPDSHGESQPGPLSQVLSGARRKGAGRWVFWCRWPWFQGGDRQTGWERPIRRRSRDDVLQVFLSRPHLGL